MTAETALQKTATPITHPLQIADFRKLWLGATTISLGVQFYAVALVWLVLSIFGSGVALGTLLTAAAIPRAISMLVTGALIDRYPPRRILVLASALSSLLVGGIALLLGADLMTGIALFIIAPLSGLLDAVFYPVTYALLPRLIPTMQLSSANAFMQIADTLANILGPSLSGFMIGAVGLTAGFGINAALFVIGFVIISSMSARTDTLQTAAANEKPEPFARAIWNGIRYAVSRAPIRLSLMLIALLNFAAIGPIIVGGALLIERRFMGDAADYGFLTGAFGAGMLAGMLLLNVVNLTKRPGLALVYTAFVLALGLVGLGLAPNFIVALAICFGIGVAGSITNVSAVTWLQIRTEPHMQGRMSSLLVFAAIALDPFSNALSGVIAEIDLTLLFVGAGALVAAGGAGALFNRTLREERLHEQPAQLHDEGGAR